MEELERMELIQRNIMIGTLIWIMRAILTEQRRMVIGIGIDISQRLQE